MSISTQKSAHHLIKLIASDSVLDTAYHWLCKRRAHHGDNSDIWHVRFHWHTIKPAIQKALLTGTYVFEPTKVYVIDNHFINVFYSRDAIVIKAIALVLAPKIHSVISKKCYHLVGRGGLKGAIRYIATKSRSYQHVLKSDVYSYYGSLNHAIILRKVSLITGDSTCVNLIRKWLSHLVDYQGHYTAISQGIAKGCALSPLIGALYLHELDTLFVNYCKKHRLVYARYQDDWVCLTRTKYQLRHLIKTMYGVLNKLKIRIHPDKTFFGRIKSGFDFLGYRFNQHAHKVLGLAKQTIVNHLTKYDDLYEKHGRNHSAVRHYVTRWKRWVLAGLKIPVFDWLGYGTDVFRQPFDDTRVI